MGVTSALPWGLPGRRPWTPTPALPLKNGEGGADCGTWARCDSVTAVMAGLDPATQITRSTLGLVDKANPLGPRVEPGDDGGW